jgi:hypothetical protein
MRSILISYNNIIYDLKKLKNDYYIMCLIIIWMNVILTLSTMITL